jgi:DNA polymerase
MQKSWSELYSHLDTETFTRYWEKWVNDSEYVFSAHNAFFEQSIYNNVLVRRFGWPKIPIHKWRCTAAKAAAVAIPRNLKDAGAVMCLPIQKDFEGHRVMMRLCKPTAAYKKWNEKRLKLLKAGLDVSINGDAPPEFWTPETAFDDYKILYHYCKIDVLTEEKLDEILPDLIPSEQTLWFLDQRINLRGVAVDMDAVKKISDIMGQELKIMSKELDTLTMGLVSSGNARNAILDFLTLEGIELPDLKAKTVDDFLTNGVMTGDAQKLLEIRRALSKSSTAKYQKFLGCAKSDGRVRDLFLFCGSSTGRWSGKNIQPQNFPRGIIKNIDEAIGRIKTESIDDLKMLYGENLMPLFSSVLRGMFIASPGHDLFVEDFNAIETRVLWWLAGHEKGLNIFREGRDPYKEMAAVIYNTPVFEIEDDSNERQVGKAAVLGCGYQMGGKKFVSAAWDTYRAHTTLDMAKVAVTKYRQLHYPVVEMWGNCEGACILAIENPGARYVANKCTFFVKNSFLWIELPGGRGLAYKNPAVEWENVILKDDNGNETGRFMAKKIRYWAINMKAKKEDCAIPKWTREATYGGKIVENIVQAVSRNLLSAAMVRAEKRGFKVLMHSHDELVSEALIGEKHQDDYKKIMVELPIWAEGLPLKSGGWVGNRYRK